MEREHLPEPGFLTRTSLIQLGYGIWVNLTMVVIGLTFGFTSVALPQLSEPSSHITVTLSDQSWITSVLTVLSPLGCVITGYLVDKIGRRVTLILCHLPVVIGWFCTAIAKSAKDLIIGRTITGFGIGMIVVAPRPYLSEISLPRMRGVIGTFPNLALSIGVIIQAGLGSFCSWRTISYTSMLYSITFMISNYFLPETPHYLLMTSTMEKAEASLRKFRSSDYNIAVEIEELRKFKVGNDIHSLTWKEKIKALFRRSACKPFFIIVFYFVFTQASGVSVMAMWTVQIIQHSKSSVDPHTGNILLGTTRFLSGIFTSVIIFRVGRRPLALISSLGVGITCVTVSIYIINSQGRTLFPQFCYMGTIIFSSLGYYTLPVLIMSELYPLQIRGILGGFSTSVNYFLIFAVNKLYPYMTDTLGFHYSMMCFGVSSLLGCLFLYFFLPETKGLKLQEIEENFKIQRPSLERESFSLPKLSRSKNKNLHEDGKHEELESIGFKKDAGSPSHGRPTNKEE